MSLNPVEIELRKPGSFGHNQALARLLGDSYRPNRISPSLAYQAGESGEGGGGGDDDFGYNPGNYAPGYQEEFDVPTQISGFSTRSIPINQPIFITLNELNLLQLEASVSLWYNADVMGDTDGVGLWASSASSDGYNLALTTNGDILYGCGSGENIQTYSPGDQSLLSGWHHVVFGWSQFDNEGTPFNAFRLFVDGVQVADNVQTPILGGDIPWDSPMIGRSGYVSDDFSGKIDDFRMTRQYLEDVDVEDMYDGVPLTGVNVRVIYTFETEGAAQQDIVDHSTEYLEA